MEAGPGTTGRVAWGRTYRVGRGRASRRRGLLSTPARAAKGPILDGRPPTGDNGPGMRLATFNIKHGELRGLSAIEQALREADADVVGLQEVGAGTARSGGTDQARALGEPPATEWPVARRM